MSYTANRSHPPECPRTDLELYCPDTGEVRPAQCRRLRCPECLPSLAYRRGLAIAWSRPERFLTLTSVGDDWPTIRGRAKRFRHELDRDHRIEWVWSVEVNPAGTGHHLHAYQRGQYLPQARVAAVARRVGMGVVADVRMAHKPAEGSQGYFLKSVGYQLKAASGELETTLEFLEINGRRLTHQSRGYFGAPVREVEKIAARAARDPDAPEWVLVKCGQAARVARARARPDHHRHQL